MNKRNKTIPQSSPRTGETDKRTGAKQYQARV